MYSRLGSPPRPWGRRPGIAPAHLRSRFTPTPVGTTSDSLDRHDPPPVHPHARGDDAGIAPTDTPANGSPPRPWGRLLGPTRTGFDGRFTPTPVGTTRTSRLHSRIRSVHPHARGDDGILATRRSVELGSPPRPWGRHIDLVFTCDTCRFTPTPVGTTVTVQLGSSHTTVHPHARGDDVTTSSGIAMASGSPPRPWGRRSRCDTAPRPRRFTPTPVGTTWG